MISREAAILLAPAIWGFLFGFAAFHIADWIWPYHFYLFTVEPILEGWGFSTAHAYGLERNLPPLIVAVWVGWRVFIRYPLPRG